MRAFGLLGLLLLGGCAQSLVAVLPPEEDGKTGGIAILDDADQTLAILDQPNTQAGLRGAIAVKPLDITKGEVGALLQTMPAPPITFTLYFRRGDAELVEGSKNLLDELFGQIARRPGAEILVIGHTDTIGEMEMNDRLSIQRAEVVVQLLLQRGLNRDIIRATGRGEREPIDKLGEDEAPSELNSRVEIIIR